MARQLVIGLGNKFVRDDGVGIRVVEELRETGAFAGRAGVEIREYEEMDISILQEFKDASRLILVDSVKSGTRPGTVSLFEVAEDSGDVVRLPSLHELELSDLVSLGRKMKVIECPVVIVGIEPGDLSPGEGLSEQVEAAVPVAARAVAAQLEPEEDARGAASAQGSEMSSGPRLTIVLVNQSASMGADLADYGISMAEGVSDVLNLYLQKVTQKRKADRQKGQSEFDSKNFGVAVIVYGAEEGSAERVFYMDADEVWADESRTKSQGASVSSDNTLSTFSTWISPVASAKDAPLSKALAAASGILEAWVPTHRLAPPPHVINITDGTVTGGDPGGEAERLKRFSTFNGPAVLWTCQLTAQRGIQPVLFPNEGNLGSLNQAKATLFRSTSEFPGGNISNLVMEFPEVSGPRGARACVFDADLRTLVRFVSFVTRVPLP